MSKSDPVEKALDSLAVLRGEQSPEIVAKELRVHLNSRSNLVVAKAAKIAGELPSSALTAELVAAFKRFMVNPQKLDKRCAALTEIAAALYQLDYREPEVYIAGLHHVQKEASFGPPIDTAAALRGICAQALLRTGYPTAAAEVVNLLVDPEAPARMGAIRALGVNGGDAGVLLLRLKVLTGDAEAEVVRECFSALLDASADQSLAFVSRYLEDDDDAVAEAAIWALGESRLKPAFDLLKEKWDRTVDRPVRKVLLAAMAASRLEEAIDFLRSLVATGNSPTACDAVSALAIYKGNESIHQSVASVVRGRGEKALSETYKEQFQG
jgi:HEAT repeat protein